MKIEEKVEKLIGNVIKNQKNAFAFTQGNVLTEVRISIILGVRHYPLLLLHELIPQLEKKIQGLKESSWYRGKERIETGERLLGESKWFLKVIENGSWNLSLFSLSFDEVENLPEVTKEAILHPTYYWLDYFRYLDEVELGRIPGEENGAGHLNFINEIADGKYYCSSRDGKEKIIIIQFPHSLKKEAEMFGKEYFEATKNQRAKSLQHLQEAAEHPEKTDEILQKEKERQKENLPEYIKWLARRHSIETKAIVFLIHHLTGKSPLTEAENVI